MFTSEQQAIETQLRSYCQINGLPDPGEILWKPIPFTGEWGISTSLFALAAQEARLVPTFGAKPVAQRAQEIAAGMVGMLGMQPGFNRIEAVRGYLNLYFNTAEFAQRVIQSACQADYGRGLPNGQQVMLEFSHPNTHKAFHVGHLRSAILGDTLARILEFAGYEVVRANYPGDIGLHVIIWLWNYMKFHAGEKPETDITRWMGDRYLEARKRLEDNPDLELEVRELYKRWDQREPEVTAIWQETRQWSLDGFHQIYDLLGVYFDRYYFNSQMEHPGKAVVQKLIERGIAVDERPAGPVIVRIDDLLGLKKETYRVMVCLRSDNTALYATEDLALAIQKFEDFPELAKSIYIVDVRQSLHFQQVFKTLEIAGYPFATRCEHIPYELVNLPGNVVMASREGTVVLLEELIREATQRARLIVEEKNPDLSDPQKDEIAYTVAIGALRYTMLARENTKTVTFDWEIALDFNGQAAPYIQYAHVRANSILRKAREEGISIENTEFSLQQYQLVKEEIQLTDIISRLPGEIQRAAEDYKPLLLASLGFELAKTFTDFYNNCPVLKADPVTRDFRLRLVLAARQAMQNTLACLGIQAPEVM